MRKQVFAIYDSKAAYYRNPFILRAEGEATRGFIDLVNDNKTEVSLHPEDFTLFHLGSYDEERGKFDNLPTPVSLGCGIEYKRQSKSVLGDDDEKRN